MDLAVHPSQGLEPDELTQTGFVANILKTGSSLHPTFLLILDIAFAVLAFVFLALLFLTGGSIHILILMVIEGCLYASVKWSVPLLVLRGSRIESCVYTRVVNELQNPQRQGEQLEEISKEKQE